MKRTWLSARVSGYWYLPLLAAIALPACSRTAPASKAQAPSHTEPSEAERFAYAKSVVAAFDAKDRKAFDDLVDWRSICEATIGGFDISEKERGDMYARMERYMSGDHGLAAQLIDNARKGSRLHFLGTRQREGRQVLLFRMLSPIGEGEVSYFEFYARHFPAGKVRAADIYLYSDGEFLAAAIRRLLLPVIAERSRTVFDRLISGEQDYVKDFPKIGRAGRLMSEGKSAEALEIFRSLRPATRRSKAILRSRLQAAQSADEKEFLAVFDEFRKLFPDDSCVQLFSLNVFLLRKEYPAALEAVDRLDRSVGGDPYLDVVRANIHDLQNDTKAALACVRRAVEREPTLLIAHLFLLGLDLRQNSYNEALARMKDIEGKLAYSFDGIEQDEEFAGFVKSPQYSRWLEFRESKATPAPAKSAPPAAGRPKTK